MSVWRFIVIVVPLLSPIVFITLTAISLDIDKLYVPFLLIINHTSIGLLIWYQVMFSMNLFNKENRNKARFVSLALYISASLVWLSTSYASINQDWTLQFVTSFVGSFIRWIAFITAFNGDLHPPTRQQWIALPMNMIIQILWELRAFTVNITLVEN